MKIAFIIAGVGISGGVNVIFEHAVRMNRRGQQVSIITSEAVLSNQVDWHQSAKELNFQTFQESENRIFDIVIATWWETVYELTKLKASHYVYFVQSIESKLYAADNEYLKALINFTYQLSVTVVTEAHWIQQYLEKYFDKKAYLVRNGIYKNIYINIVPIAAVNENKIRILIEGDLYSFFKNTKKTIEICQKSNVDEIWLLTPNQITEYKGITKVFSKVPIHQTPAIYSSCDVLVKLSLAEGMFGPPLEMFHCGGTAIVYDVTGYDDYIQHNINALVVKTGNENKVIEYINYLKANPSELARLKNAASETAKSWHDWEEASLEFENVLIEISNTKQSELQHQILNGNLFRKLLSDYETTRSKLSIIQNSFSYKAGLFLTLPFRRLKNLINL